MNGNKILQKCIEELKNDKPEIKYVLGMLEALLEMQPQSERKDILGGGAGSVGGGASGHSPSATIGSNTKMPTGTAGSMDEAKILEENMKANLNKADLSSISTEQPQ